MVREYRFISVAKVYMLGEAMFGSLVFLDENKRAPETLSLSLLYLAHSTRQPRG